MALVAKTAAFEVLSVLVTVKGAVLTGDEFPSVLLVHGVGADSTVGFTLCGDVCPNI